MPNELKILVIEDDEDDLFLINSYLSDINTFKLVVESEMIYEVARNKILLNKHDIYIVDYFLGPETGLELIRDCVKHGITKPFILLTGRDDKKIDIEAARVGAYDYLTKLNLNSDQIERSLRYSVERYSAYAAISESEFKYREIFTRSNDIIFVLDERKHFVNFNPMMSLSLGYMPEELIDKPISCLFDNEDLGKEFALNLISIEPGNSVEVVLRTKENALKTFLLSCSRVITAKGNTTYQGIMYDYTNIRKAIDEKLFKEKIESTHRLVRTLAHEIRNPLTNIDLSLLQLQEELDDEKLLYIDIIRRNSKRINDLLGDLMSLSRPAQNSYELIDMNYVVRSALAQAQDRIRLKQISISEDLHNEILIWADKSKLQIAFLNIIINGVEAVEHGKGKLKIESKLEDNIPYVKISDNGPGIAEENLSQLFQPYFTQKKNGMGLGLATTHAVIQAHQGSIEVNSALGKGTSFTVKMKMTPP